MKERLTINPGERDYPDAERNGDAERERLAAERERNAAETSVEKTAEIASSKHEALEAAEKVEKRKEKDASPAEKRKERKVNTASSRKAEFNKIMKHSRTNMSAPSRAFSKLIHIEPIEKASEAIGSTVARPNAILSGSVFALVLTAGVYLWAKEVGYPLSGFETIGAFIIGWLAGIIFDFTRIMITGKR